MVNGRGIQESYELIMSFINHYRILWLDMEQRHALPNRLKSLKSTRAHGISQTRKSSRMMRRRHFFCFMSRIWGQKLAMPMGKVVVYQLYVQIYSDIPAYCYESFLFLNFHLCLEIFNICWGFLSRQSNSECNAEPTYLACYHETFHPTQFQRMFWL